MEMLIRSTERLVMLMMRASQINLVQIQQQVVVNSSGVVHLTQAMQNNFTSINAAITQNDDALKKAAKQQSFWNRMVSAGLNAYRNLQYIIGSLYIGNFNPLFSAMHRTMSRMLALVRKTASEIGSIFLDAATKMLKLLNKQISKALSLKNLKMLTTVSDQCMNSLARILIETVLEYQMTGSWRRRHLDKRTYVLI